MNTNQPEPKISDSLAQDLFQMGKEVMKMQFGEFLLSRGVETFNPRDDATVLNSDFRQD